MLGFVTIIGVVIVQGVYVTIKLDELNRLTESLAFVNSRAISCADDLFNTLLSQVSFGKKYFISKDKDFLRQFYKTGDVMFATIKELNNLLEGAEQTAAFGRVKKAYDQYLCLFEKEINFMAMAKYCTGETYAQDEEKAVKLVKQGLRDIIRAARQDANMKLRILGLISTRVSEVTMLASGLAITVGFLISFVVARKIYRPLLLLRKKTSDIAKGNFEATVQINSPPEIQELADDFNLMCEQLKELDRMKSDFINHVFHELRTPLTAIREASDMLLEGAYSNMPEKQHELLKITKEECERLIESVNKILDLSRMEAGMMSYDFRAYDPMRVIRKSVLKLAPLAQKKSIDLELKPSPHLPHVRMDKEKILQVLENLMGNALKFFSGESGRLVVACVNREDNQCVEVSVSDNGPGIPREEFQAIFKRFKRIERGKGAVRGTGLGLYIVKHIVTAHGGKIWVESEPGQGSSFFFTLPYARCL
jgi:two-component system sensor histidine kinase GlrK